MLPLIAILLPVLLIFLGFAVDLAYMQTTRMELQAAADAAARAGATRLSQTDDVDRRPRRSPCRSPAEPGGRRRAAAAEQRSARSAARTRNDSGKWVFTATAARRPTPCASRRSGPRGSRGGPVSLFFGSLIGTPSFQPVQSATASFLNVDICLVLDRSHVDEAGRRPKASTACTRVRSAILLGRPTRPAGGRRSTAPCGVFLAELDDSRRRSSTSRWPPTRATAADCPRMTAAISTKPSSLDCSLTANLSQVESAMDRLTIDRVERQHVHRIGHAHRAGGAAGCQARATLGREDHDRADRRPRKTSGNADERGPTTAPPPGSPSTRSRSATGPIRR